MTRVCLLVAVATCLGPPAAIAGGQKAKWTFMVYMNGDSAELEDDAIDDFLEMAEVGSTEMDGQPAVQVVVQLDRIPGFDSRYGNWTDALRFHVLKGAKPRLEDAICGAFDKKAPSLRKAPACGKEVDMGDGATLRSFVTWARDAYPADHYALVIWGHGHGWRLLKTGTPSGRRAVAVGQDGALRTALASGANLFEEHVPVKSVSNDATSGTFLYNRDIEDTLTKLLGDTRLDVIGFDACLMAMIETAYAMRHVADVFVGSEEDEPEPGWNYQRILSALTADPNMSSASLGKAIVGAYRDEYGNSKTPPESETTQSAIALQRLATLTDAVGQLARTLIEHVPLTPDGSGLDLFDSIRNARRQALPYAYPGHVDLDRFVQALIAEPTIDETTRTSAANVRSAIDAVVIDKWAHPNRRGGYGSNGIGIYFKNGGQLEDAYQRGSAQLFPVEFVDDNDWSLFLNRFLMRIGP